MIKTWKTFNESSLKDGYSYIYTIITKEKLGDKSIYDLNIKDIKKMGYHFNAKSQEDLDELQNIYKVGNTHGRETIVFTQSELQISPIAQNINENVNNKCQLYYTNSGLGYKEKVLMLRIEQNMYLVVDLILYSSKEHYDGLQIGDTFSPDDSYEIIKENEIVIEKTELYYRCPFLMDYYCNNS